MSNDTNNMNNDKKSISYGAKLRAAREALGLEQKDLAAQLRLGERIIAMLESGHYAADVPITFIRGYIRSYSKLLQIPESEVASALEPIQPAPAQQESMMTIKQPADLTSSNYYMQFSTYAIVATLAGMLGLWWYNHAPSRSTIISSQTLAIADMPNLQDNKQVTASAVRIPLAPIASTVTKGTSISAATTAAVTTTSPTTASPTGPTVASATPAATKPTVATKHIVRDNDDDDDDEDDNN